MVPSLLAQATPPATPPTGDLPATGEEVAPQITMKDAIRYLGWCGYPLAAQSIAMVALIVFNGLQITKGKFVPKKLSREIMDLMGHVRVRSAIEVAAGNSSFFGRMMAASLPFVDATDPETLGRDKVEEAIADFSAKEQGEYMAWVQYFTVVAQTAPMVGLLGTVSGMIQAFNNLSFGGSTNTTKLAANISEALWTTAAGLVIAIPCIIAYYIFKNKLVSMIGEAIKVAGDAMDAAESTVKADQHFAKVPEGLAD